MKIVSSSIVIISLILQKEGFKIKISGRFVRITNTKFVPDRLVIFAGEAITFKLDVTEEQMKNEKVYQVKRCFMAGSFLKNQLRA